MNENRKERLDYYRDLARKKGYRQETIEMGYLLSMTGEMVERFGDKEKTLEEVIKICEKQENGQDFITEVVRLAGVE